MQPRVAARPDADLLHALHGAGVVPALEQPVAERELDRLIEGGVAGIAGVADAQAGTGARLPPCAALRLRISKNVLFHQSSTHSLEK